MQCAHNNRHASTSRLLMIAVASLWLPCACAAGDAPAAAEAPTDGFRAFPASADGSKDKIRALIGDAACDSDAQCRTMPIGAKACGGPEAYVAWSTRRTDADALRNAMSSDNTAHPPRRSGMVSNCSIVSDPGAYCAPSGSPGTAPTPNQGRTCQLRSARQGGKGAVD